MKDKFCINSIASFKDVNSAQTNQSKTKQTFSFSKSSRFQNINPVCQKNTYGGEFIKRKNSGTFIGYGKRSDFTTCLSVSPSSSKYHIKTAFQQDKLKKKGRSFGIGRDKVVFDTYINKQPLKFPGSKYQFQTIDKIKAPVFSMRKKTKIIDRKMTIDSQNDNPGPGSYKNPQIDINSSNFASKFQRISFSSSRSNRFNSYDNKIPGPGKYKQASNLSAVGKYVISHHNGGTIAKFDKKERTSKFDQIAKISSLKPGPGNYKVPSQFGQYDGDVYGKFQTANINPRKSERK